MFVFYNPELPFDVRKSSDRCFCGCSAIATYSDPNSINYGYCKSCAKKRTDFVNQVTGEISLGSKNSFEYSVLVVIENLRQSIFKERFYFMVDNYFAEYQDDEEFTEPYENASFMAKIYREKYNMMEMFLKNIVLPKEKIFGLSNKIRNAYSDYNSSLMTMSIKDSELWDEFRAKAGGYSLKRKVENNEGGKNEI